MSISSITINRGQGGLGRPLATSDHISGFTMPFVNANLPSGFATTDRIKIVFSIEEAEALGILEGGTYTSVLWYHINAFFQRQPEGKLFVQLTDSTSITYLETITLQQFANGEIRQIGYFDPTTAFLSATVTTIQGGATTLEGMNMPVSIIYAANFQGFANLAALPNLRSLAAKNVSVCVGEDGAGVGAALALSTAKSVTCLGACLGAVSFAGVHQNIGYVDRFNAVFGTELDEPAFAVGAATVLYKTQTSAAISSLNDYGYIFLRKHVSITGSYFNDAPTAITESSDYAYIESVRTIDKAVRGVRFFMTPNVNAPLYVTNAGLLSGDVISKFKNDCERALEQMDVDGEISAYKVTINPEQNVLSTSTVEIAIKIVPVGVARQIVINIGFAVNV